MSIVEFSIFPIDYWAHKKAQERAIVWEKGNSTLFSHLSPTLSWQEFSFLIEQAVAFIDFLAKSHRIVAYSGTHRLIGLLCYLASLKSGRQVMILNPAMTETQRHQVLRDNQIEILITDQDFEKYDEHLTACKTNLSQDTDSFFFRPATFTLTSGSSGKPKAIVHSISQHLANAQGVCEFMQFDAMGTWLLSLPLFHVSGQGIVWRWLSQGATLFLTEKKEEFWQMLFHVTHASLVPTQLQRYLVWLGDKKVSQHILLGGMTIPKELIIQAKQHGITTYTGYGMTEMASTICAVKNEIDNVGQPLAYRDVKIVEQEIWVKGASLALGYWDNGEIVPLTNQDGWFETKDRGRWSSCGKLEVLGRLDNMFISGGENIQPEEVEQVLLQYPSVKQVFVVPIADEEFGERPVAVVEFNELFNLQAVSLLQHFAMQHLEKFKQPVRYLPMDKNIGQGSGIKISRQQIKAYVEQYIREHNV